MLPLPLDPVLWFAWMIRTQNTLAKIADIPMTGRAKRTKLEVQARPRPRSANDVTSAHAKP